MSLLHRLCLFLLWFSSTWTQAGLRPAGKCISGVRTLNSMVNEQAVTVG